MKNRIREVLSERGISQKELAQGIGMSEIGLSRALDGSATLATITKVANFLRVEAQSLIVSTKVLKAKFGSDKTPLRFGELEIPCYVLEDGTRAFSGRGLQRAIGYESKSGQWMKSFSNLEGIRDAIHAGELSIADRLANPIKFTRNDAGGSQSTTNAYEATLLIDICSVIIDANRAGVFNDERIVFNADVIIRSVAKVGIIALIDEATGYNKEKDRAKDELQKFLSKFLREEASKWVKTFPDSFFEMIYRLNGWSWTTSASRPGYVGQLINDWVYQRIGPKVKQELEIKNPKLPNGRRAKKHHQFLTEVGKEKLGQHLESLGALARAVKYDKAKFIELLNNAYPRPNEQFTFDFDWEDDE